MRTKRKGMRFLSLFAVMVASLLAVTIIASAGSVIIKNGGLNVSNSLYVDPSTGVVGIGTTTPYGASKLDVVGGGVSIDNNQGYWLRDTGGTPRYGLGYFSTGNLTLTNRALNGDLILMANNGVVGGELEGIRIKSTSGYVGIGYSSPTALLHITQAGTSSYFLKLGDTAASVNRFVVDGNGNVGIGTTSPAVALHVANTSVSSSTTIRIGGITPGAGNYTTLNLGISNSTWGYSAIQSVRAEGSAWGDLILNLDGGNVGIGTANPTEGKLVVNGNIGFTGATATAARINSGSYTGNNTANRAIAHGLGRIPKYVSIYASGSGVPHNFIFESGSIVGVDGGIWNARAVTAWDATNFYVGNAVNYIQSSNVNLANYYWVAYG